MSKGRSYVAGLFLTLIMGLSFLAAKIALDHCTQECMLAWRFACAAVTMWGLKKLGLIHIDLWHKPWLRLLGIALVYPVLSFIFEAKGVALLPSSEAGVIVSLMPVISLMLGAIFLGERPRFIQVSMVLLSVVGVVVIALYSGTSEEAGSLAGVLFLLVSCTCGSSVTILVRKNRRIFSSIEMTYFMNVLAAAVYTVLALGKSYGSWEKDLVLPMLQRDACLSILYLGLGCSVAGFFCLNYLYAHLEVARASVFTNLVTVVSVIAGVVLRDEHLSTVKLLGMACILIGVWGVNYFVKKEDGYAAGEKGTEHKKLAAAK